MPSPAGVAVQTMGFLRSLEPQHIWHDYTLVHASPRQPIWEYILDPETALENFPFITTPYCLVGHTHQPVMYQQLAPGGEVVEDEPDYTAPCRLNRQRFIINPGSVGQPRDNNPGAAYALLDTDAEVWQFCRVAYDIGATQSRLRAAGLPERLAARLSYGW